ncbi:uncharacterized protein BO72DRAFT_463889 [Aspergillus fijiensis CBS 313.89]|uniref:Uncharacterized protein n=1 Tax=Aspergillus fijiensis CBS 313.89 TaxID=1448319 RepID=A0A8G1RCR4_9EURO|nr:uncharacterized protein BO72DRAFT_463889 [Aspergillus fijiensis CBS 313.89]RAK71347.1 hypothetical protein BO72DRAFT_463889 [Aspergillus fijiensis CBS 313.89]
MAGMVADPFPHEAYAHFVDDVLVKHPREVAKIVGPIVGPVAREVDEALTILALVPGTWPYVAAMKALSLSARGCRGLYRYLIRSSESMGYTPDEDLEAIASRMTVEIMTRTTLITIAVDTSNASLPETLVAGASLPCPNLGIDSSSSNNIAVSRIENSQAAHGICNPIVNHVRIHGPQIVQATQVAQVIKELNYISTELRDGYAKYRRRLTAELDYGKDIVFHVLVPSWYKLCIREPLHFPADLYPLRIEGELYHGKMVVEMNLPAAPPLHPRGSFLDPGHWDTIAAGAALVTTMPSSGVGCHRCLSRSGRERGRGRSNRAWGIGCSSDLVCDCAESHRNNTFCDMSSCLRYAP